MPVSAALARLIAGTAGLTCGLAPEPCGQRLSTSSVALDDLLSGGVPRGVVTELAGTSSSGKTSLAYTLTATVTVGDFAAWIDLPDAFDPDHAHAAGVSLGHVLWVRPRDPRAAFRAAEHVADAGGFSLIVVDLDLRHGQPVCVPAGGWLRLARAAARGRSAIVALAARRTAGTFATLALETIPARALFSGVAGACPLFEGIGGALHLRKNKIGPPKIAAPFVAATCL